MYCFYLNKSARCNGRKVVLQAFFKNYITLFAVFVKVELVSHSKRRKTYQFQIKYLFYFTGLHFEPKNIYIMKVEL